MEKLILFVHGLGGSKESFGDFGTLIKEDEYLSSMEVAFFDYETSLFYIPFLTKLPKIQSFSKDLEGTVKDTFSEYNEIIIVCHSMGGLIAKRYLLDIIDDIKSFKNKISKVVLYATPNFGSDLAFGPYSKHHPQIAQLRKDSDFLESLNKDFNSSDIKSYINFYYIIGGLDRVVDRVSASGLWDGNYDEISNKTHMGSNGIAKPKDCNDRTFTALKTIIKEKKDLP